MKKKLRKTVLPALLIFIIGSCVTINIYFPAAAVEKAAEEIVKEVYGEEEQEKEKGEEPQGLLSDGIRSASLSFGPRAAYAQEADINITTPAIRALRASLQQRMASIKPYLDGGNVGEKAQLTRLVDSDNRDREALYVEIAKANNFGPERVADIKKLFAKSWIKEARGGWWVQEPDGKWQKK
jgi:uncharacterized protein YdbL (DUF1318 family)